MRTRRRLRTATTAVALLLSCPGCITVATFGTLTARVDPEEQPQDLVACGVGIQDHEDVAFVTRRGDAPSVRWERQGPRRPRTSAAVLLTGRPLGDAPAVASGWPCVVLRARPAVLRVGDPIQAVGEHDSRVATATIPLSRLDAVTAAVIIFRQPGQEHRSQQPVEVSLPPRGGRPTGLVEGTFRLDQDERLAFALDSGPPAKGDETLPTRLILLPLALPVALALDLLLWPLELVLFFSVF